MSSGEGGGGKLLLSEGHEGGPGAEVEAEGIRGLHSVGEKQLEELFNRLDKNKDGKIDVQELKDAMESMGHLSKTQAQAMMDKSDTDSDGLLDFREFATYCREHEKKLWLVFQHIDKNNDGEIEADEIRQSLNSLGLHVSDYEIQQLLHKMDKDGNVKISWEEWREFLLLNPDTSMRSILQYWSHGTATNIGESLDNILLPDEFAEEETEWGMWFRQLVAGGGAGGISRTCTAPLDRLKIFFQVQSLHKQRFTVVSCLQHMIKEGGVRSLWRGNGVNVVKIAPESALRFFAFEHMKRFLHEEGRPLRVWERLLAGSTAGVIAQTVIYPMEVLKTRLALGQTGQYRGIFDCAKQILRVEGPRAFYKGISPSLVGIIPYAGIDFTIYELLKNFWLSRHDLTDPGVLVPLACGTVSSTCGQVASYPLSLVRTRLQSQVTPLKGGAVDGEKALGMAETIQLISRTEGLRGLYRGILPNFLKVIPSVSIGYLVYEKLKLLLGVQTIR